MKNNWRENGSYVIEKAGVIKSLAITRIRVLAASLRRRTGVPLPIKRPGVEEATMQAVRSYRMRPYRGQLTLILADEWFDAPDRLADNCAGWTNLVGKLEMHRVPGGHTSMLRPPNIDHLAERLRSCLEKAQAS